jgi:hypothetical protein
MIKRIDILEVGGSNIDRRILDIVRVWGEPDLGI